jgi:hypothetical protein
MGRGGAKRSGPGRAPGGGRSRAPALALALTTLAAAAGAAPPSPRLIWPLGIPGTLLSSFGEYRYDHLHAGIDISTGGGTGYRVLAAAPGVIYRLKMEWRGYGRAIYIRHRGGRVTLYGHLERFEDRVLGLERRLRRRQAETGSRYPGDLYLDPPVRVRQGQLIGFSGESGFGLPHLHFEVREREDRPIDPFAAGLDRPPDRRPPVLESITVTAARADSFIDGTRREAVVPLRRREGIYRPDAPIRVSGPFLLSLAAHDPAGASGRAGLARVGLRVDGAPHYDLVMRSFRFDQFPQAGLIFDHRGSRLAPAAFAYRLARLPGNDLARGPAAAETQARPDAHPGAIDLAPGSHRLEIEAADAAGHRSRARVCVLVARPGAPEVHPPATAGAEAPLVRFSRAEGAPPVGPPARAPRGAPPACPVPAPAVEGEIWAGDGGFAPVLCSLETSTCAHPPDGAAGDPLALRLRERIGGVPGRWVTVALGGEDAPAVADGGGARLRAWPTFLEVTLPVDRPRAPDLALVSGRTREPLAPFVYRDALEAAATVAYEALAEAGGLAIASPADRRPLTALPLDARLLAPAEPLLYRGPGFTIDLPAGARFYPGPLVVRTAPTPGADALPALSDTVELLPEGEALKGRAVLAFHLTGAVLDAATLGIYRFDPHRGRWAYEGGEVDPDGSRITVPFRRYGRFALLQDVSPPAILEVHPGDAARGVPRRPRIWARVEDEGEGLNFDGVSFVLDGAPLEAEFDPDRGRSQVLEPPLLPPGPHRLEVVATDTAGNASPVAIADFDVR